MTLKPITVYWRALVPNPSKVVTVLEELGLPYVGHDTTNDEGHSEHFLSTVNPNGKVLAIHDPNTNLTIWESGACIFYLVDHYDTVGKISFPKSLAEKYHAIQWQHLQASGQGPYFGQAAWFCVFHPEPIESAKLRYINEMKRIIGVLDAHLEGKDWLVGNKCSFADLSFIGWNVNIGFFMSKRPAAEWDISHFPNFKKWHEALVSRPSASKALAMMKEEDVHSG